MMNENLFPANDYAPGSVRYEMRAAATRALVTEVTELVAAWYNGQHGAVLDQLCTIGNRTVAEHATLVAAVLQWGVETEEDATSIVRGLARRALP